MPATPTLDKPKAKRGFALMTPEQRSAIARRGGSAVRPDQRSFSKNRKLAAEAGRKGGQVSTRRPESRQ